MGFLLGCFAYLLFSMAISLRMDTGDFYFVLPALANDYSNELFAVIIQVGAFSWFGTACGIAYLFSESVDLEPIKQGAGYLVSLTVGMLPLAWIGHWMEHKLIGIFSYIIIVAVVSLLLFVVGLVKLKEDVDDIKQAAGIGKEVHSEEL